MAFQLIFDNMQNGFHLIKDSMQKGFHLIKDSRKETSDYELLFLPEYSITCNITNL